MTEASKAEANKKVVRDYVEAFNRGDVESLKRLFAPGALVHGVLGWGGLDAIVPIWREIIEAFAIELEIESLAAEGDAVAALYRERGASVREFRGQAATGRAYEVVAMEWFIVRDGLIERRWGARDSAAQFRQMGLSPG